MKYLIGLFLILWGAGILLGVNIWRFFWPLVLIVIGWRLMSRDQHWEGTEKTKKTGENYIDEEVIFYGINKKYVTEKFGGGKITCVFGGGEIDLTQSKMEKDEEILKVTAVFGGLKIRVPKNWRVETDITGVLGGFSNETENDKNKNKRLLVKGEAVFGGIDIVN